MNEKSIKALKWKDKDQQVSLGGGLYIRIKKTKKVYIIRKAVNGKAQIITLGESPDLSFKDAKYQASILSRKKDVSSVTVSELKEDYWKNVVEPESKVPNQVIGYLNNIENEFGHRKIMEITKFELVQFIKTYSQDRGGRSADRMRSYLKQLFSYAVESGLITDSPMDGVTKRITGYSPIDRKRVLSDDEIKMIWNWKNNDHGWQKTEDNKRIIQFLILTGLRITEARTGYIDGDLFRVDDTKEKHSKHEKRPHWVYLTPTARALLPLPSCTATNIQAWLKRRLIAEGYEDNRFTPHDCRRTFVTRANQAGSLIQVVEKCVNHKLEGMLAVYNQNDYTDERIECAKTVEKIILEVIS
ncbi:MAG: integrase family protein [gamma proteobacterium symbiont of Taylorina sp.]|nr:integrase family protein [gamma proteobacterium symbiont of Taylorina sp.]